MQVYRNACLVVLTALVFAGCSIFSSSADPAAGKGGFLQPEWIDQGTSAVRDGDTRYFMGVGVARGRLRPSLLKQAAKKKSKDQIKEPLTAFIKAIAGPWLKSLSPKVINEMNPKKMLDALRKRVLRRVSVDETHVGSDEEIAYAMARLDLMAVLLEMQASPDILPMLQFAEAKGIDPTLIFDQIAGAAPIGDPPEGGGDEPEPEASEEPPAEESE